MRKLISLFLLTLLPINAIAQDKTSVVTLKNGTVLKGIIKSIDPNDALTIVIAGLETSIKMDNVAKIEEDDAISEISSPQINNVGELAETDRSDTPDFFIALSEGKRYCFNILSKANKTVEVTYNKNVKYTDTYYAIPPTIEYGGQTYTVVQIGREAFNENKKIETLEIPSTVKVIGEKAFEQCKYLAKIQFSPGLEVIGEKAFSQCMHLTDLELPSGLTEIGDNAFFFNNKLERIVFPNTLKKIGKGAFSFCIKITEINLPIGLERIEDIAFFTTKIEKIDIPNTVKFIGTKAFLSGTTFIGQESIIKWISIPESVIEIGKHAFCKFQNLMGTTRPSKCHIELLPSWMDENEAKRIGISEESYRDYKNKITQ